MRVRVTWVRASVLAGALAALCWGGPAAAQDIGGGIGPSDDGSGGVSLAPVGQTPRDAEREHPDPGAGGDKPKGDEALPPPPSLPGSHAQPVPVAPASKSLGEMNPTDALFDAINRGDTPAARDALSRGADPNGKNVLGLTPIDLSVDLGRNDISFLLLSLRTTEATTTLAAPASLAGAPRGAHHAATGARSQSGTATRTAAGGAPAPDSGFLGFGGNGS